MLVQSAQSLIASSVPTASLLQMTPRPKPSPRPRARCWAALCGALPGRELPTSDDTSPKTTRTTMPKKTPLLSWVPEQQRSQP